MIEFVDLNLCLPGTEMSTELALLQGWTELALEVELHGCTELALDELWVVEALPKCTVLAPSSFHGRGVRIFKGAPSLAWVPTDLCSPCCCCCRSSWE